MQLTAFFCLIAAFSLSIFMAGVCLYMTWTGNRRYMKFVENGQFGAILLLGVASAILLRALVTRDFSFQYVAQYSDSFLPLFYAVTAFWAGQAGSFLFWTITIAVCGGIFVSTRAYQELQPQAKELYWVFFFSVQAFFLLVMIGPSNPFLAYNPAPPDGNGLNPLLQNPGMIFHPPLLFIGYAGFTVPACLALAAWATGDPRDWLPAARNWTIVSWLFLTAGIVLGAWWAYMELGWGGYWAWDPVENASLIPWLGASAFIHTAVIQARRNALHRTNVFLISLTLLLCFFATYVVRSGVIDSLHAYPDGGVGKPLFLFMIGMIVAMVLVTFVGKADKARQMDDLMSRPGLLMMAAWLFLALGGVVFLGTMWPVISNIWSTNPVGLDAGFYNKVCLPLFMLIALFLVFCPWLGWKGGIRNKKLFIAVSVSLIPAGLFFYSLGIRQPVALLGAASSVVAICGIVALFASEKGVRRSRASWGAYGVHVGLALMVLGVAFSGPYTQSGEATLHDGEKMTVGAYEFTYHGFEEHQTPAMAYLEARITASKDGRELGEMRPQRRKYRNNDSIFAEVSVIPSLGDELYATLIGSSQDGHAVIKINVNPLVNWVWIGGTMMCLFPLLILGRKK